MSTPTGEKRMTVAQATFIGVGSMVGAGIFALLGAAGAVAGSAVWVSFLVAGAIAGLQGYSFAKLGSVYPSGGGMLTYLSNEPATAVALVVIVVLSTLCDVLWKRSRDGRPATT